MNFIKDHKGLSILAGIVLLILIFMVILYFSLFTYKGNRYGDRLKHVSDVKISSDTETKLESELSRLDNVSSVEYRLEGRLINVIFDVESSLEIADAKLNADKVLEYFTENELKSYDVQVFLNCSKCNEETIYPVIGYKHKTSEKLSWTNS